MQPAKRSAASRYLLAGVFAVLAVQVGVTRAQTAPETQQQANERLRALSASSATPAHDYVIGRGDLVAVEVFDVPELTRELRVSQTGTIGMPLFPVRLYVAGLTEMQTQQKIAEILESNGIVSHPQVIVSVKEKRSRPITIVGAVTRPMVYQAERPVTLAEVLAEAGGISADAGDVVIITRQDQSANSNEPPEIGPDDAIPAGTTAGNPAPQPAAGGSATTGVPAVSSNNARPQSNPAGVQNVQPAQPVFPGPASAPKLAPQAAGTAAQGNTGVPPELPDKGPAPLANTITVNLSELLERGDATNNVMLQGGDIVTVPHAGIVYALGALNRPGGYVSSNDRSQLSTLKLLALAGGMTRVAKKDKAVIIRKDATGNQVSIPVDLSKIVEQKVEDVRLMPSDILYIPDNTAKAALIRIGEVSLAIGTAIAVYRIGTR